MMDNATDTIYNGEPQAEAPAPCACADKARHREGMGNVATLFGLVLAVLLTIFLLKSILR